MPATLPNKKLGRIAMILDDRISREKGALLTRAVNSLRQFAEVQLLAASTSEDALLKKLEAEPFQLILAPWYRYLAWTRVEAFYGLTRTSGPTFAGYHCEPLAPYEIGGQADHLRAILLDFGHISSHEIQMLIRSLIQDSRRAGLQPLLRAGTPIYCEHWYSGRGLGSRIDSILGLSEIANSDWKKRSNALRICISALWSLIYEEGPGKAELNAISKAPRAGFQLGVDAGCLALRLSYCMPQWSPKDTLGVFWPDVTRPSAPSQLLLKFADFVRVHTIPDVSVIEVVVGFLNSSPSERAHGNIHSLWVEPITANLMIEGPFDMPGATAPHLKLLPVPELPTSRARAEEPSEAAERAKDRYVADAAVTIRELKAALADKDRMIRELRSGGVGTAPPLPPPDAESLLEAFQERYFEARYQIREFEVQIAELEARGATAQDIEALKKKMEYLASRENNWIRKIAKTIEAYRKARPKPAPSSQQQN